MSLARNTSRQLLVKSTPNGAVCSRWGCARGERAKNTKSYMFCSDTIMYCIACRILADNVLYDIVECFFINIFNFFFNFTKRVFKYITMRDT